MSHGFTLNDRWFQFHCPKGISLIPYWMKSVNWLIIWLITQISRGCNIILLLFILIILYTTILNRVKRMNLEQFRTRAMNVKRKVKLSSVTLIHLQESDYISRQCWPFILLQSVFIKPVSQWFKLETIAKAMWQNGCYTVVSGAHKRPRQAIFWLSCAIQNT